MPATDIRKARKSGARDLSDHAGRAHRQGSAGAATSKPAPRLPRALYIVATPIGNLGDFTLRARDTLRAVDVIACEDTRVTGKLLRAHAIGTPMTRYHDHNAPQVRPKLLARLFAGESVALVCDAGTPLISDPGFKLITAVIETGIDVVPVPGPSSALAALVVSGLPTDRFLFAGFPPPKRGARRRAFEEIARLEATLVFFESPRRLAASLADMAELLGDRPAAVARELTKLYEEVRRESLAALAEHYRAAGPPKGEIAIIVGPPLEPTASAEDVDRELRAALATHSLRDAVDRVAAATGMPRREVYARALGLGEIHAARPKEDAD